jgi:predicted Zn-dependent protease
MKTKYVTITVALFMSLVTFAQKNEIKLADKAMKSGNSAEAKSILEKVDYMIGNSEDAQKTQYYFIKGNACYDLAKKKIDESNNLVAAAEAYNQLLLVENNVEYYDQVQTSLKEVRAELFNKALVDDKAKKHREAAVKLYQVYQLGRKDTIMLYYAAGSALNSKDYDLALTYYNELKDINYSGKGTSYLAKNKISEVEETFNSLKDRDFAITIGTHTDPKTENIPSKRGEIYKYITQIYIYKGDVPAAKKAIVDARALNPDDTSLLLAEADLYLKTEDYAMYKKLISEATLKNPNDADLFYNLGVISSKMKDGKDDAEKNYIKAISIDPKYKNAYMNLTVLKLEGESKLVEEMNKLGTSAADNKKYEVLKIKRQNLYKSALVYLEKAEELFVGDKEVRATLLNVYNALDMTEKYKALKAKN